MKSNVLIALLLLGVFLLGSGCIIKVENQDKFSSDPTVYNFTRYLNASRNDPVDKTAPCTCMVCSAEKASWLRNVLDTLLPGRWLNFSLTSSSCNFVRCNQTSYEDLFNQYIKSGGMNCDITNPVTGVKEPRLCGPRFFMLGQGADSNEYARAQGYCNGQLKMPVTWAVPNETGELAKNISPTRMSCYLSKDQMPMIVWYSAGRSVASAGYTKMLRMLNQTKDEPKVDGPIMVSTEALYDPYKKDGTLDFDRLDAVAKQIRAIRKECPKCLSVLALKPVFEANNTQIPDLCALDYLLNDKNTNERPAQCLVKYGANTNLFSARISDLWEKVDIVGVGFMANENANLTVCSPDTDVGRHMLYSREVLGRFYKPSVWYAVGIAAGPTATPDCYFNESEVGNSWESIIGHGPALAGSGIIGVAPYRFSDDPDKAPLNLTLESSWFNSSLGSLDPIRNPPKKTSANPNVRSLVIVSSTDPNVQIGVDKYVPTMSGQDRAVFVGGDGAIYAARMNIAGQVEIFQMGGQYGFQNVDGTWHNTSAYLWFSNCEFYARNRGPQWTSDMSIDNVGAGTTLVSSDGKHTLGVSVINSTAKEEILFYGEDGRPYALRRDGPGSKLYDRPVVEQGTQQPIMFPTNGKSGAQCMVFESTKMYSRVGLRSNSEDGVFNLTPSKNAEDKKTLSAMSCGGAGGCLAETPMPKAFCYRAGKATFEEKYCTVYPQIDEAAAAQDFDSWFMRSIFQQESSFKRTVMSHNETSTACTQDKDCDEIYRAATLAASLDDFQLPASPSPDAVRQTCQNIQAGNNHVCAMGLAQCIDSPFSTSGAAGFCGSGGTYNPFNPFDSTCCGTYKMVDAIYGGQDRTGGWLARVQKKTASDPVWRAFILPGEEEWYAAWFAMRNYRGAGPDIDDLDYALKQVSQSELNSNGGPVGWVDKVRFGSSSVQYYSTNTIVRYNDALEKCGADCPYQDCSTVIAGGSGGQPPFTP